MYFDEENGIHRVANVETRVHKLKTGMHEFKADMKDWKTEWKTDIKELKGGMKALEQDMNMLKTGMKESKMEQKSFQYDILQKFDTLETKFTSLFTQALKDIASTVTQALKDHESATKKQLDAYSVDQQKLFPILYYRSLFSVSLTLYVIYQFLTQSRCWVSQCY